MKVASRRWNEHPSAERGAALVCKSAAHRIAARLHSRKCDARAHGMQFNKLGYFCCAGGAGAGRSL
jgi:hypothetical protein